MVPFAYSSSAIILCSRLKASRVLMDSPRTLVVSINGASCSFGFGVTLQRDMWKGAAEEVRIEEVVSDLKGTVLGGGDRFVVRDGRFHGIVFLL